jgi:bacteriorhodopsin
MKVLYGTKVAAFVTQILSTIVIIYALTFPVDQKHAPIRTSVYLEMIVQVIQIIVYSWLLFQFRLSNMATTRYADWFLTTPLLLLAFMVYVQYESDIQTGTVKETTLHSFIREHQTDVYTILIANTLMLLFGFIGELGIISRGTATLTGFVALAVVLERLYTVFASKTTIGTVLLLPFAAVWSTYGIAYNFNEIPKNITYNILDTVAKNAFGLFLSYKYISVSR